MIPFPSSVAHAFMSSAFSVQLAVLSCGARAKSISDQRQQKAATYKVFHDIVQADDIGRLHTGFIGCIAIGLLLTPLAPGGGRGERAPVLAAAAPPATTAAPRPPFRCRSALCARARGGGGVATRFTSSLCWGWLRTATQPRPVPIYFPLRTWGSSACLAVGAPCMYHHGRAHCIAAILGP
jgi:hypothetical protein